MALTPMHLLVTFSVATLLIYAPTTTNSQTTTMQCRENQEYRPSVSDCPTCSNYRTPRTCPPGCVCKEGFLPDDNGNCVEKAVCESCKGNTMYSSCAFTCGGRCTDIGQPQPVCHIPRCKGGCVCKEGFLLDAIGNCVEKALCESCTGNTTYSSCAFTCGGRCKDIGKPQPVCHIPRCKGDCVCKEGFLLDAVGNCVEKAMCESCTGNTTYSSCAYACGRLCEDIGKPKEKCFIPRCKGGCVCKQEYWYLNNNCVLQKDCPCNK
ncbi:zonadhesin-like [Pseudophryne corroboree]|uniref:zonadhesin-like n=1 Tax=Pseudophryne corroboree TaxID=495146 RepID=UPI00308141FF